MKKISTYEKTRRIFPPFSFIIRVASLLCRTLEHVKVKKIGRIPKPPYLLLLNHASFMDYFVGIKGTLPYQPYWVATIEEYIDKDFVFRELGVVPKRKFTNDPRSAKMMLEVLRDRKKILIIFPEARYSFCGKAERVDNSLGKLVKNAHVPVVFMHTYGHYLRDPQWGNHKIRKVRPMRSEMRCIVSKKYVDILSSDEIDEIIREYFNTVDDEAYQIDNNILIKYPKRAEGIERILYKCPHCGKEFEMSSKGANFKCDACGVEYTLNENGTISCLNSEAKFTRVTEWYYWEKECVKQEVNNGTYFYEDDIRLEHLEGTGVGFVPMKGHFHLTHTIKDGITVTSDTGFTYKRSALQNYAIHIEFNYHGRGSYIDLATNTETYFAYPLNKWKVMTKIHFANEAIYDLAKSKIVEK